MSKKNQISDYQFSLWSNKTHVGVDKVGFNTETLPYIESAIDNIMNQIEAVNKKGMHLSGLPVAKVPYTIFPDMWRAMQKYSKDNGDEKATFLVLYHKHLPIGKIQQDIPKTKRYCGDCGSELTLHTSPVIYNWYEKLIRVFFKEAFHKDPETFWMCKENPEHKKIKLITF